MKYDIYRDLRILVIILAIAGYWIMTVFSFNKIVLVMGISLFVYSILNLTQAFNQRKVMISPIIDYVEHTNRLGFVLVNVVWVLMTIGSVTMIIVGLLGSG